MKPFDRVVAGYRMLASTSMVGGNPLNAPGVPQPRFGFASQVLLYFLGHPAGGYLLCYFGPPRNLSNSLGLHLFAQRPARAWTDPGRFVAHH